MNLYLLLRKFLNKNVNIRVQIEDTKTSKLVPLKPKYHLSYIREILETNDVNMNETLLFAKKNRRTKGFDEISPEHEGSKTLYDIIDKNKTLYLRKNLKEF